LGARPGRNLEQALDQLADAMEERLDVDLLLREAGAA
jgi:hypothetical protein